MTFDLVSFDVQGTLTDAAFGDAFWLDVLPGLYAARHGLEISEAKRQLREQFVAMGPYDARYYSVRRWLDGLRTGLQPSDVFPLLGSEPRFFQEFVPLLEDLQGRCRLIAFSSTTREFLARELGERARFFARTISSLDDLGIPGKPKAAYGRLAKEFGVDPARCLHVGDSLEMDVTNARQAGWKALHADKKRSRREIVEELRALTAL